MITIGSLLAHQERIGGLFLQMDGNVRAALLCWAIVLSAFIILRIPRQVVLGCLLAAAATVGLAATAVDVLPEPAVASAKPDLAATSSRAAMALRGPATYPTDRPADRERPY